MPTTTLNYLWINRIAQDASTNLPDHYLQNAIRTANRNSDTITRIWIDFARATPDSLEKIRREIRRAHAPIELCDLRTIARYRNEAVFDKDTHEHPKHIDASGLAYSPSTATIWRQVDYAKLLLVAEDMERGDVTHSFFSDFDVLNLNLANPEINHMLTTHGIVIAREMSARAASDGTPENSFFGFDCVGQKNFMLDVVLPNTREELDYANGFWPFMDSLHEHGKPPESIAVTLEFMEPSRKGGINL
jgi:hypothetical protein